MNPVSSDRSQPSQAVQRHIEVLRAHLGILRELNTRPQLIDITEQALKSAEEQLRLTQES